MVLVDRANPTDRADVERLIAAYHESEGVKARPERISWAVEQHLRNRFPGVLLIAREKRAAVGVALAVYQPSAELGRVLVIQDFFVDPTLRRDRDPGLLRPGVRRQLGRRKVRLRLWGQGLRLQRPPLEVQAEGRRPGKDRRRDRFRLVAPYRLPLLLRL